MENAHLNIIKKLMKMIENEEIVFKDQYGVEHKVFNNQKNEFMYKESVYFKYFDEPTLHNPHFPCKEIRSGIDFVASCNYQIGEDRVLYENKCWNCVFNNSGKDYQKHKKFLQANTYIPDIAIGEDKSFKYWIEVVNSHPSSENKRKYIRNKEWIVLEIHIQQFEDLRKGVIECFNISTVNEFEYSYITRLYDAYSKIHKLNTGQGKVSKVLKNKKTSSVLTDDIKEYLGEILATVESRMIDGETLDFLALVDSIATVFRIENKEKLSNGLTNYIGRHLPYSVISLGSESYPDSLIKAFNLKRRRSVVHRNIADKIYNFNKGEDKSR